ncbi:MAG: L,D-transpeptidase [Myxococcota bacterium]
MRKTQTQVQTAKITAASYRFAAASVAALAMAGCTTAAVVPLAPVAAPPAPTIKKTSVKTTASAEKAASVAAPEPTASPAPEPPPGPPRLWATKGLVRIYDRPDRNGSVIGVIRAGQGVVLKETELTTERTTKRPYKCTGGWYPVEPRGFACVGGDGFGTLDPKHPGVIAARAALPDLNKAYPFRYGTSVGAPRYLRIPTEAEQRQAESGLDAYRASIPAPNDKGAIDLRPAGKGPSAELLRYLDEAQPELVHEKDAYDGYKVAFTDEFDAHGRTWLLTADLTFVPKDKIRQRPLPMFKGIDLKQRKDLSFPLGFFWTLDTKKWQMGPDRRLYQTDEVVLRHSFVEATLEQARGPGGLFWKLRDGYYVPFQTMSLIRTVDKNAIPSGIGPKGKWIDVRVTWGYLIAYENRTDPVYVTAVSPGAAGIAKRGNATARGKQYVDWKLYTGDMSGRDGKKDWFIDEIPWVQYYKAAYALHGAFWHDDYGRPKSHGCINLAPRDGQFLFNWMDPVIPKDWYGVSTYKERGTLILIRP